MRFVAVEYRHQRRLPFALVGKDARSDPLHHSLDIFLKAEFARIRAVPLEGDYRERNAISLLAPRMDR